MHNTAGLQRGETGAAALSGMLRYGPGRTLQEREAGMVFNPFLEQLSLQTTKLLCIRKVNKELQRRLYPEEPLKRRLTDSEEKEISPEVQRKW